METHTRAPRRARGAGGRVNVANAVRWSRLAPPAPVMRYGFEVSPIIGGSGAPSGTRIVYSAEIEIQIPVPLPARARAAIEDDMVASFDCMCERFIKYAADRLGGGLPVDADLGPDAADGDAPPLGRLSMQRAGSAGRRVSLDLKPGAGVVGGAVFFDACEE